MRPKIEAAAVWRIYSPLGGFNVRNSPMTGEKKDTFKSMVIEIYICTYARIHWHMCIRIHPCAYIHTHMDKHTCRYIHTGMSMYIDCTMNTCVCTYVDLLSHICIGISSVEVIHIMQMHIDITRKLQHQ